MSSFGSSVLLLQPEVPLPTCFRHQRYQHLSKQLIPSPFKIQEELSLLLSVIQYRFLSKPQNIWPSLLLVRGTVCFTIHDVVTGLRWLDRIFQSQ